MRISPFKISLALILAGSLWIGLIFGDAETAQSTIPLKEGTASEIKLNFAGDDIGFYRIFMPEFAGHQVFVQILDPNDNVISEERVQTRMSVGYFDHTIDGTYSARVTNIADNTIQIEMELGDTNSERMVAPGVLVLAGSVALMITSYYKLKNYSMAQPDENIT